MATSKRARRTARRRQQAKRAEAARRRSEARNLRAAATRPAYALVAGERPELVLDGLLTMHESGHTETGADGVPRRRYDLVEAPGDLTLGPCARALLRVEAELILRDADELTTLAGLRTPDERRGDALLLLGRRVCEAISLPAAS